MENLFEQLTSKNNEYIHSVTKQLMIANKSDEEIKGILGEILPQIIENQNKGILAKKTFGSPTEFVSKYENKQNAPQKPTEKNESSLLMWIDSSLLIFGLLVLYIGGLGLFSPKSQTYPISTAIVSSLTGGFVLVMLYRFFYSKNSGTEGRGKKMGILFALMIVWGGLTFLTGVIPRSINPLFNSYVALVLGAIALVGRYFLKRKYNIQSAMVNQNIRR
ncbi:MAG: DUF1129 family protein [Streptococcaceae bacterium]|nr:DUF1129 family protein [Streptococcaceae bacterium]MCL2858571.1 DUF1129 family protein [Streptococcaceae bacterium]